MKELKEYGFRYYQPEYCTKKIWYNKDTDMEVIKYSKKELRDMDVEDNLQYELIAKASTRQAYAEEMFETIEEVINYIK
jgi:hypothetical protein